MIHYPLKAASDSNLFEKIVVSSDDDEILEVASGFSQSIDCFKRSASLSDDFTPTLPVVQDYILSEKENIDDLCCIYPCTPFLDSKILRDFYKEYTRDKSFFYFPVAEFPSSIFRALELSKDGTLSPVFKENVNKRTQDLNSSYFDAGQFYIGSKEKWLSENSNIHSSAKAMVVSRLLAVDIDDTDDWDYAENLYKNNVL